MERFIFSLNVSCVLCAQSLQLCLTLCDPKDYSPSDSSVHGVFQATTLDWLAITYSEGFCLTCCLLCISWWQLHPSSWLWPQTLRVSLEFPLPSPVLSFSLAFLSPLFCLLSFLLSLFFLLSFSFFLPFSHTSNLSRHLVAFTFVTKPRSGCSPLESQSLGDKGKER